MFFPLFCSYWFWIKNSKSDTRYDFVIISGFIIQY